MLRGAGGGGGIPARGSLAMGAGGVGGEQIRWVSKAVVGSVCYLQLLPGDS